MTDPTPGTDPATPPTPPAPPADPAPDPVDPPEGDETDPRVKRANEQAAAARIALRDTKAELEAKLAEQGAILAKLAGVFNPQADPTADPAQVAAAAAAEAEKARAELAQSKAELLVHTIAGTNGGNPVALLDSRKFADTLHALDVSAPDYPDQVAAAIKAAVAANANLAAAGQGPSRGGAPGAGQGPAAPGAVTQEQFDAMGVTQRNELFRSNPDLYRRLAADIR